MNGLVVLASLVPLLTACGRGDGDSSVAGASTTAASASVTPPDGGLAATSGVTTAAAANNPTPFAAFDFKGGTLYPQRAAVSVAAVTVPIGAKEAFVPFRLDRDTPNSVILRVKTTNGSGALAGIGGRHFERTVATVIFRPGDALEQTVRVPLLDMYEGRSFNMIIADGTTGASAVTNASAAITAVAGAAPGVAKTSGLRPARTFAATGSMTYKLDAASVKWSDAGGADAWRTRLPHGRTQPANGESGLYLDPVVHAAPLPPFGIENGEVVIRSQQLLAPIFHDNQYWYHGAAVLTGERMPATQLQYGQYEWDAMMPNRRGGWPALWLLPTTGWPPEIDVYEGFGYFSWWDFSRQIAANIHGGANGTRTFTALMQINAANAFGLSGFDTGYHRYGVDIQPDYITWFVDGQEVYQTVNPFKGTTWFPLMNVAVKQSGDYVGGTAEMRVRSFAVWNVPG